MLSFRSVGRSIIKGAHVNKVIRIHLLLNEFVLKLRFRLFSNGLFLQLIRIRYMNMCSLLLSTNFSSSSPSGIFIKFDDLASSTSQCQIYAQELKQLANSFVCHMLSCPYMLLLASCTCEMASIHRLVLDSKLLFRY